MIGSSAAGTVRETMVQAVRAGSRSVRTAAVRRRVCRGVRFIVVVVVGAGPGLVVTPADWGGL